MKECEEFAHTSTYILIQYFNTKNLNSCVALCSVAGEAEAAGSRARSLMEKYRNSTPVVLLVVLRKVAWSSWLQV